MSFKPTHVIKTETGDAIKIMLVGEEAYMAHQWAESSLADYRLEQGAWTYRGFPAKITAEPIRPETLDKLDILR